ncbi:MAG: ROK family protein [Candidatus Hydrogenedens sp.]|nr:ROK family protein [Candidatus Hydrogenedens sp.]
MSDPVYLALEIGGTKLQAALGTGEGLLLERRRARVNPAEGVPGILAWCNQAVSELYGLAAESSREPQGMGIGFGGPVDTAAGEVIVSHQVEGWNGIDLREACSLPNRAPVVVANDANAAGWGEYRLGAGRGTRNFVYMNIGSGIGGALVVDGKLYDGQGRGACEIGHTYISDWLAETPGAIAKLEDRCSGWSIERRIRAWESIEAGTPLQALCGGDAAQLTCALLGQAATQGDARATAELQQVATAVAQALANVLALFHPEVIALGGGVSLLGDVLLDPIRDALDALAFEPYRGRYQLVPCALEEDVVLQGALLLAAEAAR